MKRYFVSLRMTKKSSVMFYGPFDLFATAHEHAELLTGNKSIIHVHDAHAVAGRPAVWRFHRGKLVPHKVAAMNCVGKVDAYPY